jgi:CheY-like chemotaxis protein
MTDQIKVLMVDDEKRFRETTRKILEKKGFEVILAENGEQALEKIKEGPDVVILDIKMPGMDGHETLGRIKKIKPGLPVIMLTGHGAKPSAREALVEGAFDYLNKPCDIGLLSAKIKEAFHLNDKLPVQKERRVTAVMIPVTEYTKISETRTIQDAIQELRASFETKMATDHLMETGHRSILIVDRHDQIKGILTIRDLLEMLMPPYLSAPKPFLADSIEYSPMFWTGMFTQGIRDIKKKQITEAMSPLPAFIDGHANLMEAAYMMLHENERRLLVTLDKKIVGIIREQDLFFEMERILKY